MQLTLGESAPAEPRSDSAAPRTDTHSHATDWPIRTNQCIKENNQQLQPGRLSSVVGEAECHRHSVSASAAQQLKSSCSKLPTLKHSCSQAPS